MCGRIRRDNVVVVRKIEIAESREELNRRAAEHFVRIAQDAITNNGHFTVALAGGSTPGSLYQLLASPEYRTRIDWSRVYFFFGDERCVPPTSEDSNYRMAKESILEPQGIDHANVFRWRTELDNPEKIAEDYERTIRRVFREIDNPFVGDDIPTFDLILLGMGADGHTASLFPFSPALRENDKIAAANHVEKLDADRVTLTFPILNHAANVIFLISGEDKAETLAEVLQGEFDPDKLPSQEVEPLEGTLLWVADKAAAKHLKPT